jgi:hypothetical protein
MSSKISALPTVASVLNADLLTGVQAGANYKTTRPQLLEAAAGEVIELVGNGASVSIDNAGNVFIGIPAGHVYQLTLASNPIVTVTAGGDVDITPGGKFLVTGLVPPAAIGLDAVGLASVLSHAGVSSIVTYFSPAPGQWAGAPPTDMGAAITRLANAVFFLRGGVPIP